MGRNGALSGRFHSKGADPMFSINLPDYFYDLSPEDYDKMVQISSNMGNMLD